LTLYDLVEGILEYARINQVPLDLNGFLEFGHVCFVVDSPLEIDGKVFLERAIIRVEFPAGPETEG
jgi:hypothetical protein